MTIKQILLSAFILGTASTMAMEMSDQDHIELERIKKLGEEARTANQKYKKLHALAEEKRQEVRNIEKSIHKKMKQELDLQSKFKDCNWGSFDFATHYYHPRLGLVRKECEKLADNYLKCSDKIDKLNIDIKNINLKKIDEDESNAGREFMLKTQEFICAELDLIEHIVINSRNKELEKAVDLGFNQQYSTDKSLMH